MALPTFTMRDLLNSGIHFGHHPRRWNPKMDQYLFGVRNNVHIINLEQTAPMLYQAMEAVRDIAKDGGRILFVGTKPQASSIIAEYAQRCGQYYVNHRWLGGMLTNWKTISKSIKRLQEYEEMLQQGESGFTKKELLQLTRNRNKLDRSIGGIKEMGGAPDLVFVIDTNKEMTAVREALKLGLPVVGVVDSNCDPTMITYPIPGNDDAIRAITMYCEMISGAVLDGIQSQMAAAGVDIGESAEVVPEEVTTEPVEKKPAAKPKAAAKAKSEKVVAKEEKPKAKATKKAAAKATTTKKAATTKATKVTATKKVATTKAATAKKATTTKKVAAKKTTAADDKAKK